ncbi:MAG: type II secretion system F family protein [Anaerolineales bacterium]|nr:type II secretion system F family protein [Anaerolineales bacterium]
MGTIIWVVVVVVLIGGAVALALIGMRYARQNENEGDPLLARLAEASERGEVISLEAVELAQPFAERVLIPAIRRLGELSAGITPQKLIEDTARNIERAGNPNHIDATTLLALRFVISGFFAGAALLIAFLPEPNWAAGKTILTVIVLSVLGFFFPQLWLTGKINSRQAGIRKAMPDALDLLTICVEAGLSFDAAMSKVAEKWENDLSIAFGRCIREVQLGKPNREALRDMSERLGLPEMTSFIAAVIQSQTLGVSMAKVLRIQSDQMRMKRRQFAEELAHQAPVKMIIPMAFLTFPSIFVILLTPAVIQIAVTLGGTGGLGG